MTDCRLNTNFIEFLYLLRKDSPGATGIPVTGKSSVYIVKYSLIGWFLGWHCVMLITYVNIAFIGTSTAGPSLWTIWKCYSKGVRQLSSFKIQCSQPPNFLLVPPANRLIDHNKPTCTNHVNSARSRRVLNRKPLVLCVMPGASSAEVMHSS